MIPGNWFCDIKVICYQSSPFIPKKYQDVIL